MLIVGIGLLLMLTSSELLRTDTSTALAGLFMFVVAALPGWLWLVRGMPHLPLWEVYAGAHLVYYWLPSSGEDSVMLDESPEVRATCLLAVGLFLLAGWLGQMVVLRWARKSRQTPWSLGNVAVTDEHHVGWAWWALWVCAFYSAATHYGLMWRILPQPLLPHLAAIVRVSGTLGVFFLGLRLGRVGFQPMPLLAFAGGVAIYSVFETVGGLLGSSVMMCASAMVAYILGARRLPFVTLAVGLAIVTFFNMGKKEWRAQYMNTYDSLSLVERIGDWVRFSWEALEAHLAGERDEQVQTALERTDLTKVLVRVVGTTPREVPFWEGQTYADGLQLMVPRFINPNRPELNSVMREVGIVYGFHINYEMSQGTNISIGPIAEAWMNRSWEVLGLVGTCYGLFFAAGTVMAQDRRPEQVGFLVGMSFFSFFGSALELLSMSLLMTVLQGMGITVGVLFALAAFQNWVRSAPAITAPVLPGSLARLQAGQESQLD